MRNSRSRRIAREIANIPFLAWGITTVDIQSKFQCGYSVAKRAKSEARQLNPWPGRRTLHPDTSLPRSS